LAGEVPRIAVANGYNFAGNAALFGAADITIATKRSWIGMAGPAMIEGGGLGQFKPTDIGPIDVQSENGVVDIVADDETHAAELAKQVLAYFQGTKNEWTEPDAQKLRVLLPENRRLTYEIRSIIEHLCDANSFTELKRSYGGSIVTGFMRIEGKAIGVLANDCSVLGGAIDVAAGEKAAEFITLCDSFDIPLVSLCDTPGFMVGPDHEQQGAVRRLAKLFTAGSKITVPLIGVVIRKCYGLGAQAMLGGSTLHPLYTLAWPSGEFGPMGLEGAVKLGFKKELSAVVDASAQKTLFDELLAKQYEKGQAIEVAASLEIDAVIDPANTRAAIASVLN
jgi:acetyl-CoA carboxylase carboxyltransferase component